MRKVEGVTDATVSLNDGEAVISLEDPNEVSLAHLRDVIRNQGFTPKEAEVRVRAVVREGERGLVLELPGSGEAFEAEGEAADLARLEARREKPVVVRGRVGKDALDRIQVTSVEGDSGSPPPE